MNKNLLALIVIGVMLGSVGLACGSTSITTTAVYNATTSFTEEAQNFLPTHTTFHPTQTQKPQIELEVGSYTFYRDIINGLHFVGEIVNNGNTPAQDVQVALSLLDDNGYVVAIGSDTLSFIQANSKFPFSLLVDNAPAQWKDVKIQIQGTPYDNQSFMPPYIDLKADNIMGQLPNSSYGNYGLIGIVINTGQKTAWLVNVVAVAYDQDGEVIDVGDGFATLNEIAPGGDSPFSLEFGNITEAPTNYEVFVVSFSK